MRVNVAKRRDLQSLVADVVQLFRRLSKVGFVLRIVADGEALCTDDHEKFLPKVRVYAGVRGEPAVHRDRDAGHKTGRVIWYNLYVSKEAAESCLSDNTIWLDTALPPFPEPKEGFVVYLKLNEEQQLIYDYEPQPEPVYTDLQIIMQGLSDLELAILEGGM